MKRHLIFLIVGALICATIGDKDDKDDDGEKGSKGKGGKSGRGWDKFGKKMKCKGKEIKFDKSKMEEIGECSAKCNYDLSGAVKDGKVDVAVLTKRNEEMLPKEVHADAKKELEACADAGKDTKKGYFGAFQRCQMKGFMKVCKGGDKKDDDEE